MTCVYCVGENRMCRNPLLKCAQCVLPDRKQKMCPEYRRDRRDEL